MSLPQGLLSLASYIKPFGYLPTIIDLDIYINAEQKYPPDYFRQAAEKILSYHPEILGFNVMCNNLPIALLIAAECKKLAPRLPIIFGGPEVNFEEVELLEVFKQVDIVVRGEGEKTLLELLKALEEEKSLSDILGITYRENNKIVRNPDRPFIKNLDDLPLLDYSLLPGLENYRGKAKVEAGRGCPFQCTFCSSCKMWRRNFRMKTPQRLVREIKRAHKVFKKGKNSGVSLTHDNFLASRRFAEEFLFLIGEENIKWGCSSRLDALDESLIKKLKRAGCQAIFLGIETGSSEMQKKLKKNLSLDRLPHILKLLMENKIKATLSFIIGFPNETESQINQTLLMALNSKKYNPALDIQLHYFTLLKGSELYAKGKFRAAEFSVTDISPLIAALPAEDILIKQYPHIFSSFYCMQDSGVPPGLLHRVQISFRFMIEFFHRTTSLLLDALTLTPFQFSQKIVCFFGDDNAGKINKCQTFLKSLDLTALIALIVPKSRDLPQLMEILAEELYEFQCAGGKLSDYLTIMPHNDEVVLAHGISAKTLVLKKKLFEEVISKLYLEGSPEIEKTKKRLIEMLAIVPAQLEEQKLIKAIFNDQTAQDVINNKKCIKCKHISFCIRQSPVQAGKRGDSLLCGDNFKNYLRKNFYKIKNPSSALNLR